jgi:hypothetical protein
LRREDPPPPPDEEELLPTLPDAPRGTMLEPDMLLEDPLDITEHFS